MDFRDSEAEADFRARVRAWMAVNEPGLPPRHPDERMRWMHDWHLRLASGGWLGLSFPRDYGGQGLSVIYEGILNDELGLAGLPPVPAINHITNAIRLFGSEEQKRLYLPGLLSAQTTWCQGFSEPNAGSDLASIRTKGTRDGEWYRIDGQKIWTSEAVWAQWCLLLLRTEADKPAHRGLSMLAVPMDTPGIDCRAITTAYGSSEFAEVFFTDARVASANLLGEPGQGWTIAMQLLGYERGPADMGWIARLEHTLLGLEARVRAGSLVAGDAARESLAAAWVDLQALKLQVARSIGARVGDGVPGPEGSIDKLLVTSVDQRIGHVLLELLGSEAVLDDVIAFPGYVCVARPVVVRGHPASAAQYRGAAGARPAAWLNARPEPIGNLAAKCATTGYSCDYIPVWSTGRSVAGTYPPAWWPRGPLQWRQRSCSPWPARTARAAVSGSLRMTSPCGFTRMVR